MEVAARQAALAQAREAVEAARKVPVLAAPASRVCLPQASMRRACGVHNMRCPTWSSWDSRARCCAAVSGIACQHNMHAMPRYAQDDNRAGCHHSTDGVPHHTLYGLPCRQGPWFRQHLEIRCSYSLSNGSLLMAGRRCGSGCRRRRTRCRSSRRRQTRLRPPRTSWHPRTTWRRTRSSR